MSILIKNVRLDGHKKDVYVEGKYIKTIGEKLTCLADEQLDGKGMTLIPSFANVHTHVAMTLFRGFGDDMPLMPWLQERIWPNEAKLTDEDVYWGAKLGILEMIKTGTTAFADMYHKVSSTAQAVDEMGVRGYLAGAVFDNFDKEARKKTIAANEADMKALENYGDRIHFVVGPHAIYTNSGELLKWANDFSKENNILFNMHLAETEGEVTNCIKEKGCTPVRYLNKLGILSPRLIVAHGLYMDEEEIGLLADNGVSVVHNPASNLKLASGLEFKYCEMKKRGVKVALGTDGACSSNNLDMVEAMKLAALIGKAWRKDPEVIPATDIFKTATQVGHEVLGIKAGVITEGYLADMCLIDTHSPAFVPNHNFISNLVYAANGYCVDTVLCNGKVIMRGKHVEGEDEIMERASKCAYNLVRR
ncbi:MAG: amidohydrolase [Massilibacteroides sp.]|nr:amidohydrolase [Massilibacteroides sp.]